MTLDLEIRYDEYADFSHLTAGQHALVMHVIRSLKASEECGKAPQRFESPFCAGLPGADDLLFFAIAGVRIVYRRHTDHVMVISIEIEPPPGGGGSPIKDAELGEETLLVG